MLMILNLIMNFLPFGIFRIQEHACTLKHHQYFLVMVHIDIQEGFAPVHSPKFGNFFPLLFHTMKATVVLYKAYMGILRNTDTDMQTGTGHENSQEIKIWIRCEHGNFFYGYCIELCLVHCGLSFLYIFCIYYIFLIAM